AEVAKHGGTICSSITLRGSEKISVFCQYSRSRSSDGDETDHDHRAEVAKHGGTIYSSITLRVSEKISVFCQYSRSRSSDRDETWHDYRVQDRKSTRLNSSHVS